MKYFFILGSNPTLSLAELSAVFPHGKFSLVQTNIAILETGEELKANIIKKIGGTIKFGIIHNELASIKIKDILGVITDFAKPNQNAGKFMFGFSFYGKAKLNLKVLGMEFKKLLKQSGVNSRWVISREPTLSSVVVEQNKLTSERGIEIVIIQFDKKLLLGRTLAVQPFKELSFRDYGRPGRDDLSGMLPPKLAQIMINLSTTKPDGIILDPFCGSGTILTEAMLMGYNNLIGSDISPKAINDTKQNIEWIKSNFQLAITNYELFNVAINNLSQKIKPNSIDAIITEPYLGPQRGKIKIDEVIKELNDLYSQALAEFTKVLKPNGRIAMVWPVFHQLSLRPSSVIPAKAGIQKTINPNLNNFQIINPIPENLQPDKKIKLTGRHTIIYGREGQKVWREIVVMEKNS